MESARITNCSACGKSDLEIVIELPKLPVTSVFLTKASSSEKYFFDQGLCICRSCSHAQLSNCIDPQRIYDNTYFHRSSESAISREGNKNFSSFIRKVAHEKKFRCLLEVGANDLFLLNLLSDLADIQIAVDPIWKYETPPATSKSLVLGKFVEELNLKDVPEKPDIIISAQTFEHVEKPAEQLGELVELAAEGALIFLEVPDFESLIRNLRFDQIFHQHIQYYSLKSLLGIFLRLGCEYVDHVVNYRYWGGSLGVAVRKKSPTIKRPRHSSIDPDHVKSSFLSMQQQMERLMIQVSSTSVDTIYGYGAAQMVPTIAYHLKTDLSFLKAILDDNVKRSGFYYPGLKPRTTVMPSLETFGDAGVLITAIDSARPILQKVSHLNPRHIFIPFNRL